MKVGRYNIDDTVWLAAHLHADALDYSSNLAAVSRQVVAGLKKTLNREITNQGAYLQNPFKDDKVALFSRGEVCRLLALVLVDREMKKTGFLGFTPGGAIVISARAKALLQLIYYIDDIKCQDAAETPDQWLKASRSWCSENCFRPFMPVRDCSKDGLFGDNALDAPDEREKMYNRLQFAGIIPSDHLLREHHGTD